MPAYQRDIFGGEHEWTNPRAEDTALEARLQRRDLNRQMFMAGAGKHGAIRGEVPPGGVKPRADSADYGLPLARTRGIAPPHPLHPFDTAYQRLGTYKEVPVEGLHSAQTEIDPRRLAEIVKDPSSAQHPRKPYDKPLMLSGMHANVQDPDKPGSYKSGPQNVLINGNHRVAAEIQKGAMFVAVQAVEDTRENQMRSMEMEDARAALTTSAEGSRALRSGMVPPGIATTRTKAFIEQVRQAYHSV